MVDERVERVLLYRLGSLGDHLVALPSYRLVRRAFPRAEVRLLTNVPVSSKAPAAKAVLEGTGSVDGYMGYTVGTRSIWELLDLRRQIAHWQPQVLVYLAGARGLRAARRDSRFFRMCDVPWQIGVPLTEAMQLNHFGKTATEAGAAELEPEAARLARNLAELGDARLENAASWDLVLTGMEKQAAEVAVGSEALGRPLIAVSVGTKVQAKDWGRENWRALLGRVAEQYPGHALLMVGAVEEREASEFAAADWRANGGGPVVNLCGKLSPRESGAAMAHAKIFVGHDSGPMHLAAAVAVPCVGVFSARSLPRQWWPVGVRHKVVQHRVECEGCGLETCIEQGKKCIVSIGVDEVMGAVEEVMRYGVQERSWKGEYAMTDERPALLCISTYEKGQAFLREAARLGCRVELLTVHKLRDADWPWESLTEIHTMPEDLTAQQALPYVTRLFKHRDFKRVVALDEFDLETAALVREHLRLAGMGETRTRYFRDKLAMRGGARNGGVEVPDFCGVANHDLLWKFLSSTEGPWLLKPRWSASAIGIKKIERPDEVWPLLEQMGDAASDHLVERFVPGEIYHVEGITWEGSVLWASAHKYGAPPMQTMHHGGVFTTRTLDRKGEEARELLKIHERTIRALGMTTGVTHSEFIRAKADGKFYFLETAARVGGAFIAEVSEFASGVNPWVEWARMEVAALHGEQYRLPELRKDYAGSVICLARQEEPDLSAYNAPEVVYRLKKHHHAGLIVKSESAERVRELLEQYGERFLRDFYARMDAPDKPRD